MGPNVFANINTMAETFPSPDLHIVYLPLLEGPSNKGPAHLQCQKAQCHIFFIKRITTTLMKTITSLACRLFVTSLRVRLGQMEFSSCIYIHSKFRNGHMYTTNKQEMSTKSLHDALPFISNYCKKGLKHFRCICMHICMSYSSIP